MQLRQLLEQAEHIPPETKKPKSQLLQLTADEQLRQFVEQAAQETPLLKNLEGQLQVVPSKVCPLMGQVEGGVQLAPPVARVKRSLQAVQTAPSVLEQVLQFLTVQVGWAVHVPAELT